MQSLTGYLRPVAIGLALGLSLSAAARAAEDSSASQIEAALKLSKSTGRPILAVAGSETCGACQALKEKFHSDRQLQVLLGNYILLHFSTDTGRAEWSDWERRFPSEGNTIPKMYVVRSDGEKLFAGGAPAENIGAFLLREAEAGGRLLSEKQAAQMSAAAESARSLVEAGQYAEAATKIRPHLNTGSYAEAAVALDKLAATLEEKLTAIVEHADSQISSGEVALTGAISLVEASRVYNKLLPAIAKIARQKLGTHRAKPEFRESIKQAEAIDKANAAAVKSPKTAKGYYQAIVAKFPGTPAATLAEEKLAALDARLAESGSAAAPAKK